MKRIPFFNITGIALGLLTCSTQVAIAADNVDLNAVPAPLPPSSTHH